MYKKQRRLTNSPKLQLEPSPVQSNTQKKNPIIQYSTERNRLKRTPIKHKTNPHHTEHRFTNQSAQLLTRKTLPMTANRAPVHLERGIVLLPAAAALPPAGHGWSGGVYGGGGAGAGDGGRMHGLGWKSEGSCLWDGCVYRKGGIVDLGLIFFGGCCAMGAKEGGSLVAFRC